MQQLDLFSCDVSNQKFWEHHNSNPHVYEAIKKVIFQAIEKGYKRFSIDMCIQILRWETNIQTTDEKFKINNNIRACYARLFVIDYPEHSDLFEFRKSVSNSILQK